MEQTKKKAIPEVLIRGNQFSVVVEEAPHGGNGTELVSTPAIGEETAGTTAQTGVVTEVIKTGRIPKHSWGA
jgi:hypothetical protein